MHSMNRIVGNFLASYLLCGKIGEVWGEDCNYNVNPFFGGYCTV